MYSSYRRPHRVWEEETDLEPVDWEWGRWWDKMNSSGYKLLDLLLSDQYIDQQQQEEDPPKDYLFFDDGQIIKVEIGIGNLDLFSRMRLGERIDNFIKGEFEIIKNGY